MLSSTSRKGASRQVASGARVFCLLLSLVASLAAAVPGGAPPLSAGPSPSEKVAALAARAASPPATQPPGDLTAELQRLADATDQIEPASPDAVVRLKSVVHGLIEVMKADRREVVALRAGANMRAPALPARRHSRKTVSAPGTASLPAPPAAAIAREPEGSDLAGETPANAGAFFGKRGLTKFHRPGCVFGERIRPQDRVYFKIAAEATAAGYEACKICKPGG